MSVESDTAAAAAAAAAERAAEAARRAAEQARIAAEIAHQKELQHQAELAKQRAEKEKHEREAKDHEKKNSPHQEQVIAHANETIIGTHNHAPFKLGSLTIVQPKTETHEPKDRIVETDKKHKPEDVKTFFNGDLVSPDGKQHYKVVNGDLLDEKGKLFAHMNPQGRLHFSGKPDSADIGAASQFTHWKMEGSEDGHRRVTILGDQSANGTLVLPEHNGKRHEYEVRLGMVIDKKSGEQVGLLNPPQEGTDGHLRGGTITFINKEQPETVRLQDIKDASFHLNIVGAHGSRPIEGVSLGLKPHSADGRELSPGYINVSHARQVLHERVVKQTELVDDDVVHGRDRRVRGRGGNSDNHNYLEHLKALKSTEAKEVETNKTIEKIFTGEKVDIKVLEGLKQLDRSDEKLKNADPLIQQRHMLDSFQPVVHMPDKPESTNGTVGFMRPDESGHPVKHELQIKNGVLFDGKEIVGKLVNKEGVGEIELAHSRAGSQDHISLSSLRGAVWKLEYEEHGRKAHDTWISLGPDEGMRSVNNLTAQAMRETIYAETVHGRTDNEKTAMALAETKAKEHMYEDRLLKIAQSGSLTERDLQFLSKTPSELVRSDDYKEHPHSTGSRAIETPKIKSEQDASTVSGEARIGSEVYQIKNGELYHVTSEGGHKTVSETPAGKMHANYMVEFETQDGPRNIDLSKQERVLLQITIGDDKTVHQILGMGSPKIGLDGEPIPSGLLDVQEMLRQSRDSVIGTGQSTQDYLDNRSWIGNSLDHFSQFDKSLKVFENTALTEHKLLSHDLNQMFVRGFDPQECTNTEIDKRIDLSQTFLKAQHLTLASSQEQSKEDTRVQKESTDAIVTGLVTVTTGGSGELVSALANATKMSTLLLEGLATVSESAVIRGTAAQSNNHDFSQEGTRGIYEGLAMALGGTTTKAFGELGELGEVRSLQKAIADGEVIETSLEAGQKTVLDTAIAKMAPTMKGDAIGGVAWVTTKLASAAGQSYLFSEGQAVETQEKVTTDKVIAGTAAFLAGEIGGHFTKGGASEIFGEQSVVTHLVSNIGNCYTNAAVSETGDAVEQQRQQLAEKMGLKPEQVSDEYLREHLNITQFLARLNEAGMTSAASGSLMSPVAHGFTEVVRGRSTQHDVNQPEPTYQQTEASEPESKLLEPAHVNELAELAKGALGKPWGSAPESWVPKPPSEVVVASNPVNKPALGSLENQLPEPLPKLELPPLNLESISLSDATTHAEKTLVLDSQGNPIEKEFPPYNVEQFKQARPIVDKILSETMTPTKQNVGELFKRLQTEHGFSEEQMNNLRDAVTTIQQHGALMQEVDPSQEGNFNHTIREFGAAAEIAEQRGFTPKQTEDLLYSAMFSDGLKTKFNFTTHHLDGALAFEQFAGTQLKDFSPERIAEIKEIIREHQLAPPEFMARVMYHGKIIGSIKSEGREPSLQELADLKTLVEKMSDPFRHKGADLIDVQDGPLGAKALKLTPNEQALLERSGVKYWYVPNEGNSWYPVSRALIDSDGIDNYLGPGGLSKIIGLRLPDNPLAFLRDRHLLYVNPENPKEISSIESWTQSKRDFLGENPGKLGVATPEAKIYAETAQIGPFIERAKEATDRWINSQEGRRELGLPKDGPVGTIPGYTGTKDHPDLIDYTNADKAEIDRATKIYEHLAAELSSYQRVNEAPWPAYEPLMKEPIGVTPTGSELPLAASNPAPTEFGSVNQPPGRPPALELSPPVLQSIVPHSEAEEPHIVQADKLLPVDEKTVVFATELAKLASQNPLNQTLERIMAIPELLAQIEPLVVKTLGDGENVSLKAGSDAVVISAATSPDVLVLRTRAVTKLVHDNIIPISEPISLESGVQAYTAPKVRHLNEAELLHIETIKSSIAGVLKRDLEVEALLDIHPNNLGVHLDRNSNRERFVIMDPERDNFDMNSVLEQGRYSIAIETTEGVNMGKFSVPTPEQILQGQRFGDPIPELEPPRTADIEAAINWLKSQSAQDHHIAELYEGGFMNPKALLMAAREYGLPGPTNETPSDLRTAIRNHWIDRIGERYNRTGDTGVTPTGSELPLAPASDSLHEADKGPFEQLTKPLSIRIAFDLVTGLIGYTSMEAQNSFGRATKDFTGLNNSRATGAEIERLQATTMRNPESTFDAIVFSVDQFKSINDNKSWGGHEVGDVVLKALGEYLNKDGRISDFKSHLAGDTYAMLVKSRDSEGAQSFLSSVDISIRKVTYTDGSQENVITIGKPGDPNNYVSIRTDGEKVNPNDKEIASAESLYETNLVSGSTKIEPSKTAGEIVRDAKNNLKERIGGATSDKPYTLEDNNFPFSPKEELLKVLTNAAVTLEDWATIDKLTGLPNKLGTHEEFERRLAQADRNGDDLTYVKLDFIGIGTAGNYVMGEAATDKLIKLWAEKVRSQIRPEDIVGRTGGDELDAVIRGNSLRVPEELARLRIAATPPTWEMRFLVESEKPKEGELLFSLAVASTLREPSKSEIPYSKQRAEIDRGTDQGVSAEKERKLEQGLRALRGEVLSSDSNGNPVIMNAEEYKAKYLRSDSSDGAHPDSGKPVETTAPPLPTKYYQALHFYEQQSRGLPGYVDYQMVREFGGQQLGNDFHFVTPDEIPSVRHGFWPVTGPSIDIAGKNVEISSQQVKQLELDKMLVKPGTTIQQEGFFRQWHLNVPGEIKEVIDEPTAHAYLERQEQLKIMPVYDLIAGISESLMSSKPAESSHQSPLPEGQIRQGPFGGYFVQSDDGTHTDISELQARELQSMRPNIGDNPEERKPYTRKTGDPIYLTDRASLEDKFPGLSDARLMTHLTPARTESKRIVDLGAGRGSLLDTIFRTGAGRKGFGTTGIDMNQQGPGVIQGDARHVNELVGGPYSSVVSTFSVLSDSTASRGTREEVMSKVLSGIDNGGSIVVGPIVDSTIQEYMDLAKRLGVNLSVIDKFQSNNQAEIPGAIVSFRVDKPQGFRGDSYEYQFETSDNKVTSPRSVPQTKSSKSTNFADYQEPPAGGQVQRQGRHEFVRSKDGQIIWMDGRYLNRND